MFRQIIRLAPPHERKRGCWFRGLTGFGLSTIVALLTAAAIVVSYAHYFIYDPQVTPVELYHNTWKVAKDNIYDRSKLKDWSAWEHKYDHLIQNEDDALRYAQEMIAHLNESYTGLLSVSVVERDKERADGHYIGVGVELEDGGAYVKLKSVIEGGPAHSAGLLAGDEIIDIDGKDATKWSVQRVSESLKGDDGQSIAMTIRRGATVLTVSITRGKVPTPLVTTKELGAAPEFLPRTADPASPEVGAVKPNRVGYLRIDSFGQWSTHAQVRAALEKLSGCDALVIDLRDNPGGFIHEAVRTASLFMDEGVITTAVVRVPDAGYLTTKVSVTRSQVVLTNSYGLVSNLPVPLFSRQPNLRKGRPVILLVNGNTASAAEMFSAALIDNKVATAIGTTTYGKGIGQTYLPVGNGHKLRITHLKTFTPAGDFLGDAGQTVSNGVKPQVVLEKIGFAAYGTAGDNQFQEAVRRLESMLSKTP